MAKTVSIDPATDTSLQDLVARTGRSARDLVADAVATLHLASVGEPPRPGVPRVPFKKLWSDNDADVVLRQLDPKFFRLEEGFRFEGARAVVVPPGGDATDLASVPGFLTWLVPRYGRHTLPALLHDYLVRPGMPSALRAQADEVFRDAMGATQVPFVMRWTMWSAVSIATILGRRSWLRRALVGMWLLGYAAAGGLLALRATGVATLCPRLTPAVISLSPLVLSFLWGRRYYYAGLVTAWALLVLVLPVVVIAAALGLYAVLEQVALVVLKARRRLGADIAVNPVRLSKLSGAAVPVQPVALVPGE
ncbi:MAG: DUF1353 domain-containing protein [Mycobacteriales bacterium]|nr:DUF1353 domain-containing protein [Frankia sp.]